MERLNTKQALAFLGFTHRNTLYKRVKACLIPQHKDRGRNYYLRSELERYVVFDRLVAGRAPDAFIEGRLALMKLVEENFDKSDREIAILAMKTLSDAEKGMLILHTFQMFHWQ